ncbi:hypothetical protein HYS01_00495 [Candidatus Saccharibacteria bacterium]|nr:hypothetical protein [Candidatus Saccharibacteria bacterium]
MIKCNPDTTDESSKMFFWQNHVPYDGEEDSTFRQKKYTFAKETPYGAKGGQRPQGIVIRIHNHSRVSDFSIAPVHPAYAGLQTVFLSGYSPRKTNSWVYEAMIFESKTDFSERDISLDTLNEERRFWAKEGDSKSREFVLRGL